MESKIRDTSLKKKIAFLFLLITYVTLLAIVLNLNSLRKNYCNNQVHYRPNFKSFNDDKYNLTASKSESPWKNVPHFQLYLRMATNDRFLYEYKHWFLKGYRLNFPPERWNRTLILGFDNETPESHLMADELSQNWPYPRIAYHDKATDESIYNNGVRNRGFYDMLHPDKYITSEYVGYVDSDTLFTSTVTPGSLFAGEKPFIFARFGEPNTIAWPLFTEFFLGEKEALNCMAYFPVIIKVSHVVEMRQFIESKFKKSFAEVFKESFKFGYIGLSQFCVMCNYVWYHHRDEYEFRIQLSPGGDDNGRSGIVPGMASRDYIFKENEKFPERWIPKPRVAVHLRYLITPAGKEVGKNIRTPEAEKEINFTLKQGFCYVVGFQECPDYCKEFNNTHVAHYFYHFENWSWKWDKRCLEEQRKYISEAQAILHYYKEKNIQRYEKSTAKVQCSVD